MWSLLGNWISSVKYPWASAASTPQTAVSKTPSERRRFIWKIENFALIRSSKEALQAQKFRFEMGASIDLPTKWICYLHCKEHKGKSWIGVYANLDETSVKGHTEVFADFVSLKVDNGQCFKAREKLLDFNTIGSRGWPLVIPQLEDNETSVFSSSDGTLSLEVEMVLVNLQAVVNPSFPLVLNKLESQFKAKFRDTFQQEMENLFNTQDNNAFSMPMAVKIVSRDGKDILANRGILAARSPVFHSMFQSQMSEVKEGIIRVDDITGPALQALMFFIHTGKLPVNWKESEIVEGFTYAAHKYLLQELVDFLDQALGKVCTPKNCARLIELSKKLDMPSAELELTMFLKEQLKNASFEEMRELLRDGDPDGGVY